MLVNGAVNEEELVNHLDVSHESSLCYRLIG